MQWKKIKLNNVLESSPQYGFTASATKEKTGVQLLRITDIQEGAVDWASVPYCIIPKSKESKYLLQKYDVVFARTGATTGKTFLITDDLKNKVVFASYLIRVRPNKSVLPEYLYHFFQSQLYWSQIITRGGIKPNFNASKLKNIEIVLPFDKNGNPDIAEQKRVVAVSNKIFSEIEKGLLVLSEESDKMVALKQSILTNTFSKPDFQNQSLSEIASYFDDGNWIESKDQSPKGFWLVQTGNIGTISFRDKERKRFVSEETFKRLNCTEIFAGDILISRLPDPIGRACIVPKTPHRMITAVDCTILRLDKGYEPRYINYLLNTKQSKAQVYGMVTGSSRKRISRSNLAKVQLPIPFKDGKPDLERQKEIADELEKGFAMSSHLQELLLSQKKSFTSLRSSVLNHSLQMKT